MWSRFWSCLTLAWLASLSIPGNSTASQTNGEEARPSAGVPPDQFIAAFELTPKADFRFTWPPDSMRPAQYETVLLIVEKMPHAWHSKRQEGQPIPLRAQDHLRVNDHPLRSFVNPEGQPQVESANSAERFLVKLDQGRLRIRLIIPPVVRLDPLHNYARIRLYSAVAKDWGSRSW